MRISASTAARSCCTRGASSPWRSRARMRSSQPSSCACSPGMPEGIQTEGWLAIFSRHQPVELVERQRRVDAEHRRRGIGAEAIAVPDLALDVLGPADERGPAVGLDHQPGAGLGEAGEVVEVAAVAIRMVVVAVALALRRGRHDRHAAAVAAQHVGEAGASRPVRFEAGIPVHPRTVAARQRRPVDIRYPRAASSSQPRKTHHGIPTPRPQRPAAERAFARLLDHVSQPGRHRGGARDARGGDGRGRQLLRQRRGLRQGAERDRHGRGVQGARLAAPQLRRLDQVLLGPRPRRPGHEPQGHAQPQVPDAGDRRLAQAPAARLRRPDLLPPAGPEDADRGDGLGDERHHRQRQGALLGHERMVGGRDQGGLGRGREASPAESR